MATTIRPATYADKNFIYSTWLRGLYFGNEFYSAMDKDVYYEEYGKVLDRLLAKSLVLVACLAEDEEVVLGYAVMEPHVLHWVFVKEAWRKQGLAKQLVDAADIDTVTHITKPGNAIRKKRKWRFNPWCI